MKILVTGAKGQLGTDVVKRLAQLGIDCLEADLPDFDITDSNCVDAFFDANKPDAVIHCAAYTAVDRAESEREQCELINVTGTHNIAAACERCGAKMMYISSDYVFGGSGDRPYEITDPKAPVNVYGETKLGGEDEVQSICERHFIVRTSWVFGVNGNNFVHTMLRLCSEKDSVNVVCDQVGSPTFTQDLAVLLCDMIVTEKFGVYHATNEGFCTWAQLAAAAVRLAGVKGIINPVTTDEYHTDARRQLNSCLSKASLDKAGFSRLPTWQDALARYIAEIC